MSERPAEGVDEQEEAPEALRARAEALSHRLALMQEASRAGCFECELPSMEGRWDAGMYRLLGLPVPAPGTPAPDFATFNQYVLPEDQRYEAFMATLKLPGTYRARLRLRRTDGSVRHVRTTWSVQADAEGQARQLTGVYIDDTEIFELATRAARLRQDLDAVASLAGVALWRRDMGSDRVFFDDNAYAIIGVRPEPAGVTVEATRVNLHPDDVAKVEAAAQQALDAWLPVDVTLRYRREDGGWRHVLSRRTALRDAQGQPVAFLGVLLDDSDRVEQIRQAEQARRERELAVAAYQAKSRFLSRVSHELRTPMNAVLGFAQLLRDHEGDANLAERREWVQLLQDAGAHLLTLIDDVLDLSAVDAGELKLSPRALELARFLPDPLALVQPEADKAGVSLHLRTPLAGSVWADAVRLRQVLLNLLGNAIKYNRRGGHVWVDSRLEGDTVLISVADDGPGIAPERLREVFEPFNRLGAEGSQVAGSGIGLAVVKALSEAMGGRVAAHSEPGGGTRFTVQLPQAPAPTPDAAPPAAASLAAADPSDAAGAQPEQAPSRVLYVEDNAVNALLVQELLRRHPRVALRCAGSVAEGLALAQQWQPELLLLDMQLPDGEGTDLLRALRQEPLLAQTPCVALSANAMPDEVQAAQAAGFAEYWTKPIDFTAFLAGLSRLLQRPI